MIGIVDIGSNTIRLSCYETEGDTFRCVINKKESAGLAGYVSRSGRMTEEGIQRAIDTLNSFKSVIAHIHFESIHFFATAAIRNTENHAEVISRIREETGFDVDVISGREEALCDFVSVRETDGAPDGMVIDIGGGSTELVPYKEGTVQSTCSLNVGSLTAYRMFVRDIVPDQGEIKSIRAHVKAFLEKAENVRSTGAHASGVGGSIRGILKLYNHEYGMSKENQVMEQEQLKKLLRKYMDDRNHVIDSVIRLAPDRIHTIIPGLVILCTVMKYYGLERIFVSGYGVREGYLIRHVLKKEALTDK